ncbi:MAG: peptide ABC transporter substrate-binding protein, partial [Chloroflexi bacterium]|nr:peptide ABC transporter substrate-binding protein [Chloroflexota bacterium]
FVFYLRDDAQWSDGTSVTAGDFEYAWKRMLDPSTDSPNASLLYDIKGTRAFHQGEGRWEDVGVQSLDDSTLVVELEAPTGYLLHLLACNATCPVPQHVVELHGEAWAKVENIVTNGPFRLDSWQRDESIILSRNPTYYGRFTGNLEYVNLSLRPLDPDVALEMYEADNLDILGLVPADMDRARQRYAGEYISFPTLQVTYIEFDLSQPPVDDLRVRQALALAVDKGTLANVVLGGYRSPATGGMAPPGMPGHSAEIGLPYDPERARRLLAEAGYPDGRGFPVIDCPLNQNVGPVNEYLQAQWRENLGIEIVWQVEKDMVTYLDGLRNDTPPMLYR